MNDDIKNLLKEFYDLGLKHGYNSSTIKYDQRCEEYQDFMDHAEEFLGES
jgi:hypothetical protein